MEKQLCRYALLKILREATDEDHVMVLSTCGAGRRYVVVGKRVLSVPIEAIPAPKD